MIDIKRIEEIEKWVSEKYTRLLVDIIEEELTDEEYRVLVGILLKRIAEQTIELLTRPVEIKRGPKAKVKQVEMLPNRPGIYIEFDQSDIETLKIGGLINCKNDRMNFDVMVCGPPEPKKIIRCSDCGSDLGLFEYQEVIFCPACNQNFSVFPEMISDLIPKDDPKKEET